MLFVQFHHFAQDGIAHDGFNNRFGRGHRNGVTLNVDIANNGGDDASCDGGSFAVFVFAFFGDDASG